MSSFTSPGNSEGFPIITTPGPWDSLLSGAARTALEKILPGYLLPRRWFGSKARTMAAVRLAEAIPMDLGVYLTLVEVHFTEGQSETYVLPLAFATGEQAGALVEKRPNAVVAALHTADGEGVLYDAVWNPDFDTVLLEAIGQRQVWNGATGDIAATATIAYSWLRGDPREKLTPHVLGVEQSNTNVRYGERLLLKLFRRLEVGINPDQEIGGFLTEKAAFGHVPPVAGALEYRRKGASEPISLALLQGFVPNRGDAWRYTLDSLQDYFDRTRAHYAPPAWVTDLPQEPLLALAARPVPDLAVETIGPYLESARLLGQRTAELHLALASQPEDPVFGLEPFSPAYRQHLQRDMHKLAETIFHHLGQHLPGLPQPTQETARQVLALEERIVQHFDALLESDISALRQRIHGDYHLGQVLYTGSDFMIIDFEGEPARPLSERRQKGSPLQDVAGMLRSFHYAAYAAFFYVLDRPDRPPRAADLEAWARYWHLWVSVAYLQSYLQVAAGAPFVPAEPQELKALLDSYLLSKAVYELGYELNNRPHWVAIPLQGILQTAQAVQ